MTSTHELEADRGNGATAGKVKSRESKSKRRNKGKGKGNREQGTVERRSDDGGKSRKWKVEIKRRSVETGKQEFHAEARRPQGTWIPACAGTTVDDCRLRVRTADPTHLFRLANNCSSSSATAAETSVLTSGAINSANSRWRDSRPAVSESMAIACSAIGSTET